jgi:O-antigen ligase
MYVTGDLRNWLGVLKFSGRMDIWQVYFNKIIKTSPVVGYGLSMGEQLYQNILNSGVGYSFNKFGEIVGKTAYLHPHNEYIAIASEVGLVGLALALAFFADVIRKAVTMVKENYLIVLSLFGVVIGLLNCGVHFMLHTTPVLIFVCYIAIIEKCYQEKRSDVCLGIK